MHNIEHSFLRRIEHTIGYAEVQTIESFSHLI